jgi:tetraacyldisaccharide 4'-kinase
MNGWQLLLFPFAIIYDLVTRCRNWLYDVGVFATHSFPNFKIISVGNLAIGGTGKTPMVEYLIRKGLSSNARLAVLSRGYGRETKGVRIAKQGDTASELGDESFGYFQQFGDRIKVVVAEKRVMGIEAIQANFPEIEVIILDDAYQHRAVKRDFNILLTSYHRPYWSDFVLPAGRLRESRTGANRADAVLITKCPDNQKDKVVEKMSMLSGKGHLRSASTVRYGAFVLMNGDESSRVLALAGLADNRPFFDFARSRYDVVSNYSFGDHKVYSTADLTPIIQKAKDESCMIVTTYKDAVKLQDLVEMKHVSWGYIPIETVFVQGEDEFLKKVTPLFIPSSQSVDHP